jgi:hypothetical protein
MGGPLAIAHSTGLRRGLSSQRRTAHPLVTRLFPGAVGSGVVMVRYQPAERVSGSHGWTPESAGKRANCGKFQSFDPYRAPSSDPTSLIHRTDPLMPQTGSSAAGPTGP